jgi:putative endonuclease
MFYVYILKCSDASIYIGQTNNLERRLSQHKDGKVEWTMSRLPVELLKSWSFETRGEAVEYERKFKSGYGRKWIKDNLL